MNISEKADKYAEGKANEAITKAIAQAYMDGYRDGYNDREQEIPEDLRENGVEYVDLGLPSGTLWSSDYLKEDGEIVYLPHEKANKMKIPTEEQWKELESCCKWYYHFYGPLIVSEAKCVGPNGKVLYFHSTGKFETDEKSVPRQNVYFWLKDETDSIEKANVIIYGMGTDRARNNIVNGTKLRCAFSGFKLPVRLVR